MSNVSTEYKRLFLRGLTWDAEENGQTLLETLRVSARAKLVQTQSGKVLTGTAANGHTVTYSLPDNGQGVTVRDIAELCEELFTLFDTAKAELIAEDEDVTLTDSQICVRMRDLLQPAHSARSDFSNLRCA